MFFIHSRYVHIEFNAKAWQGYGKWAPRRLRLLIRMRRIALAALLLSVGALGVSIFVGA